MTLHAIVTGATGMVGEGVLHQALLHPDVESVLVIGRRPCGVKHDKLKELLVKDFFDLASIEQQMEGYNACFFCLGVSSIGMKEDEYHRITHALTLHMAHILSGRNPDMTFCYVSGMGTDSTERGRTMWARVKGKTENDLIALSFKASYMFRPGFIKPIPGLKNTLTISKALDPLYPLLKRIFPKGIVTLEDIGRAMINVSLHGYPSNILECRDITSCAHQ
jgi:uncharacterized protein YbjT (DUF2867 family)